MTSSDDRPDTERLLQHTVWMRALARELVSDHDRADDLLQETWLALARRPPGEARAAGPWLARVLKNLALRSFREESRRRRRERLCARPERVSSTADQLLERAELHRQVVDAVIQLEEPYRSTVLLRFFEDLRTREIARRMGIPVATVRTRLSSALRKLRSHLDRLHRGERRAWCLPLLSLPGLEVSGAGGSATGEVPMARTGPLPGSGLEWAIPGGFAVTSKSVFMAVGAALVLVGLGLGVGRMSGWAGAEGPRPQAGDRGHRSGPGGEVAAAPDGQRGQNEAAKERSDLARETASPQEELEVARKRGFEGEPRAASAWEAIQQALEKLELLWKLRHSQGDLEGMEECVRAAERLYPLKLSSPELSPADREACQRSLALDGFRKGYTRFALGDFQEARKAFQESVDLLNSHAAELARGGRRLKPELTVYRQRCLYGLQALDGLVGRPAPAELDLAQGWVTARRQRIAESRGRTVALVFRGVNDQRSAAFLGPLSRALAGRSDTELICISYLKGGAPVEAQAEELRSGLGRLGYQGAAGFDPDPVEKTLFSRYLATVGSATFLILNGRGEVVWTMQDPRAEDVPLALALLQRAARR